jgi:hypothetical protein
MTDEAGDLRLVGTCCAGGRDKALKCWVDILETGRRCCRPIGLIGEDDLVAG